MHGGSHVVFGSKIIIAQYKNYDLNEQIVLLTVKTEMKWMSVTIICCIKKIQ